MIEVSMCVYGVGVWGGGDGCVNGCVGGCVHLDSSLGARVLL